MHPDTAEAKTNGAAGLNGRAGTPGAAHIAIMGGGGAMGGIFAGLLAKAGHRVTAVDVSADAVEAINRNGLQLEDVAGKTESVRFGATTDPTGVGPVDLVLILVKGLHTEGAARAARPLLGPETPVLTLQNGWGNVPRLQAVLGTDRVLAGITVHSGTLLAPGHVRHAGIGPATIGELDGRLSERVGSIARILAATGEVQVSGEIVKVIWSKLCLNVCALPACALLRFYSGELLKHESLLELMRALLRETVTVANGQGIGLDFDERWTAITAQLARASSVRASMLQDVEARRRTEISTINGAVVEAAHRLGIPVPHNETLVWLMRALDASFAPGYQPTAPAGAFSGLFAP